jgi:hypothetical protein
MPRGERRLGVTGSGQTAAHLGAVLLDAVVDRRLEPLGVGANHLQVEEENLV